MLISLKNKTLTFLTMKKYYSTKCLKTPKNRPKQIDPELLDNLKPKPKQPFSSSQDIIKKLKRSNNKSDRSKKDIQSKGLI